MSLWPLVPCIDMALLKSPAGFLFVVAISFGSVVSQLLWSRVDVTIVQWKQINDGTSDCKTIDC